jgi:O-antigen/teichoic acid export membrane protein
MSIIFKNTILYTIGNLLPQAVAFILLPLYTKYLSPEQYGIVSSMQVLQVFLAVLFTLSMDKSIVRLFWDYKTVEDQKKFLGTIFISMMLSSIFFLLMVLTLHKSVQLIFSEISFSPYYTYAILTTFFMTFSLIPKNYYRLKNKAIQYVALSILEMISSVILIVWFIAFQFQGAEGVLKGKLFAAILILPVFLLIIYKNIKFTIEKDVVKNSLQFCFPIIFTLIAAWALGQFDRILIAKYFSLSDVGLFSFSKKIAGIISIFSGSFMLAYHPIFFELANSSNQENAIKKLRKYNNTFIIVISVFTFLIGLFSKELLYFFIDEKYYSTYKYIPIILLSLLISSISSTIIGASFQQSKKMKMDMYIGVIAAVFTVFVGILIIKPFGVNGAVVVSLISSIFIFVCGLLYANKKCYKVLVDWRTISISLLFLFSIVFLFSFIEIKSIYTSVAVKSLVLIIVGGLYFKKYKEEILALVGNKIKSPFVKGKK